MYPQGCFSGRYRVSTSDPRSFQNIIALEFGAPSSPCDPGQANLAIADYLLTRVINTADTPGQTIFVSESILNALCNRAYITPHASPQLARHLLTRAINTTGYQVPYSPPVTISTLDIPPDQLPKIVVANAGSSKFFGTTQAGNHYDSFEHIAKAANAIKSRHANRSCLIVTAAHLAGRGYQQALKLGLDPYLPPELPIIFDQYSPQMWCRNKIAWVLRELLAVPYLKLIGRL